VQAPWMGWYHVAACVYAGGGRLVWRDGGVLAAALPFSASSTAESPGLASCTARETLFASAVARRLPCLLACLPACRDRSDLTCRVPHLSPAIPISCNTLKHHISPPDHLSPSPSPSAPRALIYPSPSALPRPTAHRPKGSTDHEPPLLPRSHHHRPPLPCSRTTVPIGPFGARPPSTTTTGRPSACPKPLLT
jgi:hypothetical protein